MNEGRVAFERGSLVGQTHSNRTATLQGRTEIRAFTWKKEDLFDFEAEQDTKRRRSVK
jgi:hypothetical protein